MTAETILYGASYYHEYMPYERLERDIELMTRAGVSVVRVGESTWSLWEPEEGRFEHGWMDRVVDAMHAAGIKVIMGTPTYFHSALDVPAPSRNPGAARECAADHIRHAPEYGHG